VNSYNKNLVHCFSSLSYSTVS